MGILACPKRRRQMSSQNPPYEEFRDVASALSRMGLIREGEQFAIGKLPGGVSCDVYRVLLEQGPVCVKRALPKLRVAVEWRAPPERAAAEVAWMRLARSIDPNLAPEILGEDRGKNLFAMAYLAPETHPLWKMELAARRVDIAFATKVGHALARIHAATAGDENIARAFANGAQFHALRLEPYLLFTAGRHPDLAPRIRAIAEGVAQAHIALMHGDVSPKNILCGPMGPVFLDAETACYGDPAFDLAFCLNHLLLKGVWHPESAGAYLASLDALAAAYKSGITWESAEAADTRAVALLSAFLLARVDGKSPVEYIIRDEDKAFVRGVARELLARPTPTLAGVRDAWETALAAR